jgi:hypothetical protein
MCQGGETISMSGSYTGDCSAADFFQIDAKSSDGTCDIQYNEGDIHGISDSSITVYGGAVSGSWTIPSIVTECYGKTVSPAYVTDPDACLYDGGPPGTGTDIACSAATGSFTFISASTTTTTTTRPTTTTTRTTTTTTSTTTTICHPVGGSCTAGSDCCSGLVCNAKSDSCMTPACDQLYNLIIDHYATACGDANYDKRADANNDGYVSLADYALLYTNYTTSGWCQGQLNDLTDPCLVTCDSYGDVNDDNFVTEADANLIAEYVVGGVSFTTEQKLRADVSQDGDVTGADAMAIMQYIEGIRDTLPACSKQPPCDSYGDLNSNNYVNLRDVELIKGCYFEMPECTPEQRLRADVNNDGGVDTGDITQVKRYIGGLDATFPVCCAILSASITPNCNGGLSTDCEEGETISMSGQISGSDCSVVDFFQIDANTNCDIQYNGGVIKGIYDNNPFTTPTPSITGVWTIPPIPATCSGKTVTAKTAGLYDGGPPGTGGWVSGSSASGSFKFIPSV